MIVQDHPHLGTCHTPRVAVAVPIFHEGGLLGLTAVTALILDVGGSFLGTNTDAFDAYAESELYNGVRWFRGGELKADLERLTFENVRTEMMNRADMPWSAESVRAAAVATLRLVPS